MCTANGSIYVPTTKNLLEYVCKLELINMRDRCMNGIFKRGECNDIIEFLCTDGLFSFYYGSNCAILF